MTYGLRNLMGFIPHMIKKFSLRSSLDTSAKKRNLILNDSEVATNLSEIGKMKKRKSWL